MTRFGFEKLRDLLDEPNTGDLILSYYDELSPLKGAVPLDPDWPEFLRREEAGTFRVWTARVDKTLAGFVSFHITPHLNYRTTLFAMDAGHYLAPAYRDKGRVGFRLWRSALAALAHDGARVVIAHDNAARPLMPFFLALGFEPRGTLFWKEL